MHLRGDSLELPCLAVLDSPPGLTELSPGHIQAMLDALPSPIYTTDAQGRITYFNPACVAFSGRTPVMGSDRWCVSWKLYYPDGRPMAHDQCPMALTLKGGHVTHPTEAVAERPDGSRAWFIPHPTALRDADGRIVGGMNTLVDITERKQAQVHRSRLTAAVESSDDAVISERQEELLRQGWGKLPRVLETDAVAVLFFDYQGTLIGTNDVFLEMTGYRREQIERRELTWRTMTPPEWIEASERQMEHFAQSGRIGPYEKEYLLADGSRRWMRFAGRGLGDGTIAEFCIDITDLKRCESDARVLAALGTEMVKAEEPQAIYQKIVDAAVTLMRSDFASMQVFHPERGEAGELELLAHHGFDPEGVKFWKWVSGKSTCVCGLTLRDGARVIIDDASTYPRLDENQKGAYRDAEISAMQSTPLISREGRLLGMVSTHWRQPHRPTESELSNFDILARQAADIIERRQSERQTKSDLEGMTRLQHAAALCAQFGVDQQKCLTEILDAAIAITAAEKGDIQLLDEPTGMLRIAVQRGFDLPFLRFFEEVAADEASACGAAMKSARRFVVRDLYQSDLFLGHPSRKVLLDAGVRAVQSTPLLASDGTLLGMISTHFSRVHEPSERAMRLMDLLARQAADYLQARRAAEAIRRAKEEAEAANIAKDNFLASLSHELRTPLTPVLATLSSWEARGSLPEEFAEELALIRRNVDLEARLIDDLLDLTRIAKGKISLNLEVLDMRKVLDSVVEMYLPEIKAKRIDFSVDVRATDNHVQGDPGRLQQALWNVLKNAVKFTPEGGKIDLATRTVRPGLLEITISDNGAGMSPTILERLFQPFEQETTGLYGGLGLGLAITKALLEAQGAAIEAHSDGLGKGATFTITVPSMDPASVASRTSPAPRERESRVADRVFRVLLVEDHADTARALARLLGKNGHFVTTARSVAEALSAFSAGEFDIILSDIGLPDGSGIDLIRTVREDLRRNTPAVALTGFGMEDDVSRTQEAGFNAHLTKPINLVSLEQAIQRFGGGWIAAENVEDGCGGDPVVVANVSSASGSLF